MTKPVFDAFSSSASTVTETTRSWSHTCSGSNRMLLVFIWLRAANGIMSVDYNGLTMGLVDSTNTPGSATTLYLYATVMPDTGTHSIVVNFLGSNQAICTAISLTGVQQTWPYWGTTAKLVGTTGNTSVDVDASSPYDDLVVDGVCSYRSNSATPPTQTVGAGQTNRGNTTMVFAGTPFSNRQSISTEPGGGTITMSWTLASQTNRYHIAIPIYGVRVPKRKGVMNVI